MRRGNAWSVWIAGVEKLKLQLDMVVGEVWKLIFSGMNVSGIVVILVESKQVLQL